jgi:hypothetical protein
VLLGDIHKALEANLFNLAPHLGVCDTTDMVVVKWLYELSGKKVSYASFRNALRQEKIIHQEGVHSILRDIIDILHRLKNPSVKA